MMRPSASALQGSSVRVLRGVDGRLRAALHAHLHEDVRDVVLHGLLGEVQGLADLAIGETIGHELKDLVLPGGEEGQAVVLLGPSTEALDDTGGDRRVEQRLAVGDTTDGVEQVVAAHLLQDVARGPGHHAVEERFVVGVGRQHHAGDLGVGGAYVATDLDARAVAELDVEHRHPGQARRDSSEGVLHRAGFTDDV